MSRVARPGLIVFGLIGLLLVIAIAARGEHPTRDGVVSARPVPATLQDSLVTLLAIAYVLAVIGIVVLFFHRRPWQEPKESRWVRKFISVMVLMLLLTLFGFWAIRHGEFRQQNERAQRGAGQAQTPGIPPRSGTEQLRTREAEFQWPIAAALGGLVLLGVTLVALRRRTESRAGSPEEAIEAELARAVETTIEELRRERDPRRAVIAAYANMERALASRGLARRRAEAPLEYLGRVLRQLRVRESAVRSLTELFEYAKFSQHEIDGTMKDDAIAALVTVREDLLAEERRAA